MEDEYLSSSLSGNCLPGIYPRLVMCPNEVDVARSRLYVPPYDGAYASVVNRANQSLVTPSGDYDRPTEDTNSNIAKAAALVALMENNSEMAAKAITGITYLRDNWEFGYGLGTTDLFIRIVQYLVRGLEAYDLIMAGNFATAEEQVAMEQSLGAIAAKLYDTWVIGEGMFIVQICQNNYNAKLSTTLGIAALMLDNDPRKDEWLRFAITEANRFYGDESVDINLYLSEEGVCKEPPSYFDFGSKAILPFSILYEYMIGGKQTYLNQCVISTEECRKGNITLRGPLHSDRLKKAYEWLVKIQMPDGNRPSIDEGTADSPPNGCPLWQYIDGSTLTLWDYLRYRGEDFTDDDWIGYYLARVDFSQAPTSVDLAEGQFFEDSGQVIFRSSWEADAVYAAVLGESGKMRSRVHNHTDATSFQMFAYGEMLAIDTGYFGTPGGDSYTDRIQTSGPGAHNLILIDGEGAPPATSSYAGDVDAIMQNSMDTEGIDYTEVLATYQEVDITRSVLFASEKYLIVCDHLDAAASHDYSWRLHGLGGGSSLSGKYDPGDFTLNSDNALWERPEAKMLFVLDSTEGAPTLIEDLHPHEWLGGDEGYHNYVDGTITTSSGNPDISFLAAVFPEKASNSFPDIEIIEAMDQVACLSITGNGYNDVAGAQNQSNSITLNVTGFSEIQTDAVFFWIALDTNGNVVKAFIKGGTQLSYGGSSILSKEGNQPTAYYLSGSIE